MNQKTFKSEFYIPLFTIIADIIGVLTSFLVSYWIRFLSPFTSIFPIELGIPGIRGYLTFAIVIVPVWILTFQSFKMYRINRVIFVMDEFFQIIKCITISLIFSIGLIFFFRDFPYSRIVFVLIWFDSIIIFTIFRYFLLKFEKTLYNHHVGVKNVAIIGNNEMAEKIYKKFKVDIFAGFNVVGYFAKSKFGENDKAYLGNYESLPEKIRELKIQKLLVSLDANEHSDLFELMKMCEGINLEFMLAPDFMEMLTGRIKMEEVNGIPFMKLKSLPINEWDKFVKRTFDIVFSITVLLLISPFWFLIVLIIKLSSTGPIFYKQERVGLDGKKFQIIKFRSMKIDSEPGGPQFASKDDDRTTKIGKFMRKYSVDELPQFLNVLKGEMSVVGPRPERQFFIEKAVDSIDKYLERHRVKCGITGWAQVNGLRGAMTSLQARIDYDIYYIENWSLVFDLKIIFKTLKEALFSKSAL